MSKLRFYIFEICARQIFHFNLLLVIEKKIKTVSLSKSLVNHLLHPVLIIAHLFSAREAVFDLLFNVSTYIVSSGYDNSYYFKYWHEACISEVKVP